MGRFISACFTSITCGPTFPGRTFSRLGLQPRLRRTQEASGSQVDWLKLIDGWSRQRVSWLRSWWLFGSNVAWLFFLLQAAFGSRLVSCSSVSGKVLLSSTNEWKKSRNLLSLLRCTRGKCQFYQESPIKIYSSRRDEDDKRRMLLDAFNADLDQVTVFSYRWQGLAFPPRSRWRCHWWWSWQTTLISTL